MSPLRPLTSHVPKGTLCILSPMPAHVTPGSKIAQDLLSRLREWVFNGMNTQNILLFTYGEKVGTGKLRKQQLSQ